MQKQSSLDQLLLLLLLLPLASAFTVSLPLADRAAARRGTRGREGVAAARPSHVAKRKLAATRGHSEEDASAQLGRKDALRSILSSAAAAAALAGTGGGAAGALVKGNAPPPKKEKSAQQSVPLPKSMDEAIEYGEKRRLEEEQEALQKEGEGNAFLETASGIRYKDYRAGDGPAVSKNSKVEMKYRVLKLGKRAYDGISGEGTLLFSLGYGEDDDSKADLGTLPMQMGAGKLIRAVDEGMQGMKEGGMRRIQIRPEMGWRKPGKCSKEIDLGTFTGLVPGASVTQAEDCIDFSLQPQPSSYGAKRRMARRFDETLIAEIEAIKVLN